MHRHILPPFLLLSAYSGQAAPSEPAVPAQRAATLVAALADAFEPPAWRGLVCSPPRRIEQSPGQIYDSGLPPVWVVDVTTEKGLQGYLMWEDSPAAPLVDFALDTPEAQCLPKAGKGALLRNVPNQQQFPVQGNSAPEIASGCVPTAAANLIGFWAGKGLQSWAGANAASGYAPDLQLITNRLRGQLRMQEIQDRDGFTQNGMPLSGAFPADLRDGLKKDAAAYGIPLQTELERFSGEALKKETAAGRPVLLSCLVRLPQRPRLSWGHEVTGTGWVEIEGRFFAGVRDNFLPSKSGETTRWIGEGQIQTLLRAAPQPDSIRPR